MSTDPRVPVALDEPAVRAALASELASQLGARTIHIHSARRLSGGAIQENWALYADVDGGEHAGPQRWVLRTDSPSSVSVSLGRRQSSPCSAGWSKPAYARHGHWRWWSAARLCSARTF